MLNSTAHRAEADAAWDTQLLVDGIVEHGIESTLSTFEGSFACLMLTSSGLYCFRNAIAPLYLSPCGTLSSTGKFEGSTPIDFNKVYELRATELGYDLTVVSCFENSHNPFGV